MVVNTKYQILSIGLLSLSLSGCLMTRSEVAEREVHTNTQTQVSPQQKAKADYDATIMSYQDQFRALNGRVDTLEYQNQQLSSENAGLKAKLSEHEERFKLLEQGLLQLESGISSAPPELEAKPEKKETKHFSSTIDEADSYFEKKEWKRAIAAYQKYRDKNPSGKNFGRATYRIGICFQELNMKKEARVFYEEVLDRYPRSNLAKQASRRLKQIKK